MTRLPTSNLLRPCIHIIGRVLLQLTTLTVHLAVHQKVTGHVGIKTLRYQTISVPVPKCLLVLMPNWFRH